MTKYGFRNNDLSVNDITVENDMTIEGDMTFGDASADTFTCTGAALFSDTVGVTGALTGTSGAFSTTLGVTGAATLASTLDVTGIANFAETLAANKSIMLLDEQAGGSANGSIFKKQLVAGEAYTTTTAASMFKMYGEATATVPSGEFCAIYASLKGLHTDPGNNTSIISAHVHASNTTVVHAGVWLYGDMTNGFKMSGSTLTNALDLSQATAVTNVISLPALGTAPCSTQTTSDYTFTKTVKLSIEIGGAQYYLIADTTA